MPELRTIDPDDDGIRLDRWFKRHYPAVTHVLLQKLLRKGEVRLDGKRADAATRIAAGQAVRLPPQVVHAKDERPQKAEPKPGIRWRRKTWAAWRTASSTWTSRSS